MGVITAAHGIKGQVKIKSFTAQAADIAAYGPLLLDAGPEEVEILSLKPARGLLIATLKGVDDRNAAEALKGRQLKLPRAKLPETAADDEFYIADLIGLTVEDTEGRPVGRVAAGHDFGAGDLLEIRPAGGGATFYLPFTRASVPEVDIAGGRLVVTPPEDGERGDV